MLAGTVFEPQALRATAAELASATVKIPLRKWNALELMVMVPVATTAVWMASRRC